MVALSTQSPRMPSLELLEPRLLLSTVTEDPGALEYALNSAGTDFGDAPDRPYPTLLANNGARHTITGLFLGRTVDAELNGQPHLQALGDDLNPPTAPDDEDGVAFTSGLWAGGIATVDVIASGPGRLDAWVDFGADGSWAQKPDKIFNSVPVSLGRTTLSFRVPAGAVMGPTFARFRLSAMGGLSYEGAAPDGEVEDYQVRIQAPEIDVSDASVGLLELLRPTGDREEAALSGGSASLVQVGPNGEADDSDGDGRDEVATEMIGLNLAGDSMVGPIAVRLRAGMPSLGQIEEQVNATPGTLDVSPFTPDGFAVDSFFDIFVEIDLGGVPLHSVEPLPLFGWQSHKPAAPGEALETPGDWRVELFDAGGQPTGIYLTRMVYVATAGLDFGDAPDVATVIGDYPTLLISNGARHVIRPGLFLGAGVDAEPDGQPDPLAMGDDWNGLFDDEDGVVFTSPLVLGQVATVDVTASAGGLLDAWIDFGNDGAWDPGDQIFAAVPLSPGVNNLAFWVPGSALPMRATYARFRFSSVGNLSPGGPAPDGEVEDYQVWIEPPPRDYKWMQYPDWFSPDNLYYGWNQVSTHEGRQIAADDWYCFGPDPVTEIVWWGSFEGWRQSYYPPDMPSGFHLAIWTDVQPDPGAAGFSHPGQVIWETDCFNYWTDWVGWDYDPRSESFDAAFRFDQVLDATQQFQQNPQIESIYWLSISAIYSPDVIVEHPWGWKTLPRDPESPAPDDAVVIVEPTGAHVGQVFTQGKPIYWPTEQDSWDLAFALVTQGTAEYPKWEQPANPELPGLHANDWTDSAGGYHTLTLADDWQCWGGLVSDLHWWGNYEMSPLGGELRGSGVASFHLSIHASSAAAGLPGPVLWAADVPFAVANEMNTGLINLEGSPIYEYSFYLDIPFDQVQGEIYWFDVRALSNISLDPPMWRWQEYSRASMPILNPAASQRDAAPWQSIIWHGDPVMYSDMAFSVTSQQPQWELKWYQPPQRWYIESAFRGWDELSVYNGPQIVADDWFCQTPAPVTDVHWWGSFIGWDKMIPPEQQMPRGFMLTIWKDVPADPTGEDFFSHPGEVIWQHFCDRFTWDFVGWDFDPRMPMAMDGSGGGINPPEATFYFQQYLPEEAWFRQAPGRNIYWISIAAVYDAGQMVEFPFGWKTRSHIPDTYPPDDAVVIWDPTAPQPGSVYGQGWPLHWGGESWDMAFALTTLQGMVGDFDYGDAPRPYPTLLIDNGAAHRIVSGSPILGQWIDAEPDGQPSWAADGDDWNWWDDEDGVVFTSPLIAGQIATADVTVTGQGLLDAWIDFGGDGSWDPADQILFSVPVGPGVNSLAFFVPPGAATGMTYARFRLSTQGFLPPGGLAEDGEVEDYTVDVVGMEEWDFGDAPQRPYPTTLAADGARHVAGTGLFLGALEDTEPDGQPDPNALGDDNAGVDDEDGVVFTSPLMPNQWAQVDVTVNSASGAGGVLDAWIDYDADGVWDPATENIFGGSVWIGPGVNNLWFFVPAWATPNVVTFGRFRLSSQGGLLPTGAARDGEVEDYWVKVEQWLDFGDAPDRPYPTLLVSDGARHVCGPLQTLWLGNFVDAELDGQPDINALGDDNAGLDDEDGVIFRSPLTPNQWATMDVTASNWGLLDAWIDYNADGAWDPATESIFGGSIWIGPGVSNLWFFVPAWATPNVMTYARFRFSSQGGLLPTGFAWDGEVEDYAVKIEQWLDFGDAPDLPYPTLLISDGARHVCGPNQWLWLGNAVDAEPDGQPDWLALGDDNSNLDDEDGIVFTSPLIPGWGATVDVTASNYGYLDAWIDYNGDGVWDPAAENIFGGSVWVGPGVNTLTFVVPSSAASGMLTFARFRLSSQGGLLPTGLAWDGEVEDYAVAIEEPPPVADLGDAPDSSNTWGLPMTAYPSGVLAGFPTVYRAGSPFYGPIHWNPLAVAFLGQGVSLENEADVGPDGDWINNILPPNDIPDLDGLDDGVVMPLTLTHGHPNQFTYLVTTVNPMPLPLYTNVWFDFNRDGDWDDAMALPDGTMVFEWAVQNQIVGLPGPGTFPVVTPSFEAWHPSVETSPLWMRITLAERPWQPTAGGQGYGGSGPQEGYYFGETEDYYISEYYQDLFDFGDAPDRPYPTLLASNGANHLIMPGFFLGAGVDAELDGQPDAAALGDDNAGIDDEDGVVFTSAIRPGELAKVDVTASAPGYLNAWIDFNGDGSWAESGDQIFVGLPLAAGLNSLTFSVPGTALPMRATYARFRFSTASDLSYAGPAADGEVEDYRVRIEEPPPRLDFGDAPDPTYPTLLASNGARHVIVAGMFLGGGVDPEQNGQPDPAALGDDNAGFDDEDGVVFTQPLIVGSTATVNVWASVPGILSAWIDFNGDGGWAEAIDRVFTDVPLAAGLNTLSFAVPTTATPQIQTFARFRFSSIRGLTYMGQAFDGEVEDYRVWIEKRQPQVKWEQLPEPTSDNVFYGWNEYSVYGSEQIAADDWVCMGPEPITGVAWWGSLLGYQGGEQPPMPQAFHLGVWTDVPGDPGQVDPWSHPGEMVWDFMVTQYDWKWVGWDLDPRTGAYEACYRFEAMLPREAWIYQEPGANAIFWLSISAMYLDGPIEMSPFGWKTVPRDPASPAPDDAVRIWSPTAPRPGAEFQAGEPIWWPTQRDSWDLAFELLTGGDAMGKWVQLPDLQQGIDVLDGPYFSQMMPPYEKYLADDFKCTQSGLITEITVWSSYLFDRRIGEAPLFNLAIFADIPAEQSPTGYSIPGEPLWSAYLWPALEAPVAQALERFYDPNFQQIIGQDSVIWQYTFQIPADMAFYQREGTIYWLGVNHSYDLDGSGIVDPMDQMMLMQTGWAYGWKTSAQQWNDDAVWTDVVTPMGGPGQIPPPTGGWRELLAPWGQSLDLSFQVVTTPPPEPKWSQPPMKIPAENLFNGWDELSIYGWEQIVADDWVCTTADPVTDIHWWGSFSGWTEPVPPQLPDGFVISIWTDVPASGDQWFSHPGKVIWQTYCDEYAWDFAGWESTPWMPGIRDAVFRFDQILPPEEWFWQDAGENIYWVSIAAAYQGDQMVEYPWGWLTRPRRDSLAPDDAVRIFDPTAPVPGAAYGYGWPIFYPTPEDSWDMAFVLTSVDRTAPTVTDVLVSGTTWAPSFLQWLQDNGLGEAAFGYHVPVGSLDQLDPIGAENVDLVSIRFSEDVAVTMADLTITGVVNPSYAISGFSYDATTFTATWTLQKPLPIDRVRLNLDDAVADPSGNALDGEWMDTISVYPSGDGVTGGDFRFTFRILPGDTDQDADVDFFDFLTTKFNFGKMSGAFWTDGDTNADGDVDFFDFLTVKFNFGRTVAAGEVVVVIPVSEQAGEQASEQASEQAAGEAGRSAPAVEVAILAAPVTVEAAEDEAVESPAPQALPGLVSALATAGADRLGEPAMQVPAVRRAARLSRMAEANEVYKRLAAARSAADLSESILAGASEQAASTNGLLDVLSLSKLLAVTGPVI